MGRDATGLLAVTNWARGANGTNVGKGARLISCVDTSTCDAACAAGCGAAGNADDGAAGCASFALSRAQPPSVAAREAVAMNILTPGVLLDLELGLADGM